MSRRLTLFACFAVLVGVFLASCDTDGEQKRSIVTVSSMNNNAPFFSDVLDQGDTLYVGGVPYTVDDFVKEDLAQEKCLLPETRTTGPRNGVLE